MSAVAQAFIDIVYYVVFPILLLIGLGYALKRRVAIDMTTMKNITFNATLPAVVFVSVASSDISARDAAVLAGSWAAVVLLSAAVTTIYCRIKPVPDIHRRVMLLTTSLANLGNFGLPLQDLAFRSLGLSVAALAIHAYILVTNTLLTFTAGALVASGGVRGATSATAKGSWGRALRRQVSRILKLPPVYAIVAGIIVALLRRQSGISAAPFRPLWDAVVALKSAFVGIALLTLGAQLATVNRGGDSFPLVSTLILRLIVGPGLATGVAALLGLRGLTAQALVLAAATPSAINSVLLSLEFDNDPDFASRAVLYTTVFAPISVTIVLFLLRSGLFPMFAINN